MALPLMGVRAGAPAAQGGARPRPLRGPVLDRAAPARPDGDARPLLPPAPPPAGAGEKRGRAIARPAAPAGPAGHPAPAARVPQARARPMPLLRADLRPLLP